MTSAEATPLRAGELPGAICAVVLDSPCVPPEALPAELAGGSDSGGSSFDTEASLSPGKLGPADYEMLRVVGQGAFGKVHPRLLTPPMHAQLPRTAWPEGPLRQTSRLGQSAGEAHGAPTCSPAI